MKTLSKLLIWIVAIFIILGIGITIWYLNRSRGFLSESYTECGTTGKQVTYTKFQIDLAHPLIPGAVLFVVKSDTPESESLALIKERLSNLGFTPQSVFLGAWKDPNVPHQLLFIDYRKNRPSGSEELFQRANKESAAVQEKIKDALLTVASGIIPDTKNTLYTYDTASIYFGRLVTDDERTRIEQVLNSLKEKGIINSFAWNTDATLYNGAVMVTPGLEESTIKKLQNTNLFSCVSRGLAHKPL